MDISPEAQRNRRFWFYIAFTLICILVSYWSGYRMDRSVERYEWLEIVNTDEVHEPM